jgi:hypothetical protein
MLVERPKENLQLLQMSNICFDKGLPQYKTLKKKTKRFKLRSLHIVVRNWPSFNNQVCLKRLQHEKKSKEQKTGNCKNISIYYFFISKANPYFFGKIGILNYS